MKTVPYASAVGSFMYVMLYTRLDICYSVGIVSRYQSNLEAYTQVSKENERLYASLSWRCVGPYRIYLL